MNKNQLKHIIKEEYHNVKSFMEDKYGFTPELGQVISNPYAKSFVNEVQEPEVISQLRDIVNKKQNKKIKDPKSGKMMRVDMFSASAVTKVYDAINKSNKEKFSKLSLPKMVNVAFTVMKKESVNEAKYHKSKDEAGARKAEAIHNNAYSIIDMVMDEKRDAKEVVGTMGPALINSIKATLKHKFKPLSGREEDLKSFYNELKELLKVAESLVKRPSKAGVKKLKEAHREWWNWNFGADITLNGKFRDSLVESVNEILVIVDKFDKNKQEYGKIYYQDGGNRPGDGDIKKANKELAKLSKKHKGLTLVSVGRNSKMYDVNESVNEGYGDWVKAKNLTDIVKLSKQKKNATFYVTDDNNSRIGSFYLKNGKFAKATTANPNYDLQRNKTNLKDRSDVIYKYKVDESVNEAYIVLYAPKKGVKPVTTAAYKDKKDAEKWAKDLGGITMIVKKKVKGIDESVQLDEKCWKGYKIHPTRKTKKLFGKTYPNCIKNEGMFKTIDQIRQDSKDARDFIKNIFSDPDFKDMKNDREFLKYLKSIYEGFSSDAQRRAAFASGYKAKGKKGKKESIEEYDVENYQDVKEFVEFMKEYKSDVNEAEYQGRDVKLGKIMQGDVKKFKVYVKNPKGNVVKVNFGHKGKGGEKTMRIKKSDPARRKAFRSRHNCDNPGPRHKARYWACRTW